MTGHFKTQKTGSLPLSLVCSLSVCSASSRVYHKWRQDTPPPPHTKLILLHLHGSLDISSGNLFTQQRYRIPVSTYEITAKKYVLWPRKRNILDLTLRRKFGRKVVFRHFSQLLYETMYLLFMALPFTLNPNLANSKGNLYNLSFWVLILPYF